MKLPKDTRAAIYKANGKSLEIEIPAGEGCRKWQTYAIEGNRRRPRRGLDVDRLFNRPMIFVEALDRREGVLFATVRLVDPSVYLARQQGRAHPRQYTESIPDAIDEAERVPPVYQERLSLQGRKVTAMLGERAREEAKVAAAERDIAEALEQGEPTALAEGRRDRAMARLAAINAPAMSQPAKPTPIRQPGERPEPEPPPVGAETVLGILRDDDAASDIAIRLGRTPTKLRAIVIALQELRARGLIFYYVDADDEGEQPVGRWRHRRSAEMGEAA